MSAQVKRLVVAYNAADFEVDATFARYDYHRKIGNTALAAVAFSANRRAVAKKRVIEKRLRQFGIGWNVLVELRRMVPRGGAR